MPFALRPDLRFESITQMRQDVETLAKRGYEKSGKWELPEMLDHLAKAMSGPFQEGAWNLPWPAGPIARRLIHRMVERGRYPNATIPALPSIAPTPGAKLEDSLPFFIGACVECEKLTGETVACPPFGKMKRADFIAMQLIHGAHHLGYLKPKA